MKLYLADEEKINTFDLPQKVSESFLFSYTPTSTNIEVFFNVYSNDNKWFIKSNRDFIINGQNENIILANYAYYQIKVLGVVDPLYLFTYESYNNTYQEVFVQNIPTITIGNASTDTIIYNNPLMIPKQVVITTENGITYIEPAPESKTYLYVNKRRVKTKKVLANGDIIFVNNLKIVWMSTYIRVFYTNDRILFAQGVQQKAKEQIDNSKYLEYDKRENDEGLYKEEDFFFHKPRLVISYGEEELTIDPPTPKEFIEDVPAIFSLGTGLTMLVSSIVTAYRNIIGYNAGKVDKTDLTISLITATVMLLSSFLLPKIITTFNRNRQKKRDKLREEKYNAYIDRKKHEIDKIIKYESQTLYDTNPSSKECYENVVGVKNRLWERELSDKDFLTVRVGIGNMPSSIEIGSGGNSPSISFLNNFR